MRACSQPAAASTPGCTDGSGSPSARRVRPGRGPTPARRGPGGHTLTTVLDFKKGKMVAFVSDEKMLESSRGEFEAIVDDASTDQAAAELAASGAK